MARIEPPATTFAARRGIVEAFDDHVGAGTVRDGDDQRSWWFHCTRIADGARTIAVGASVRFRVVPATIGLEAVDLTLVDTPPSD